MNKIFKNISSMFVGEKEKPKESKVELKKYSLLENINITYTQDNLKSEWHLYVYANDIKIGYIERGEHYGFWFISYLGENKHEQHLEDLKKDILLELERYRKFFNQDFISTDEDLKSAFFNGGDMKTLEEFNNWLEKFKKNNL